MASKDENPLESTVKFDNGSPELTSRFENDPFVGTRILDNYEIVSVIAEGGMGTVYRARHLFLPDARFAVKVLKDKGAGADAFLRFKREAQTLQGLKHPNIIGFTDFGTTEDGTAFLIVDFLEGHSLSELLRSEGKLSIESTVEIFTQVCDALSFAHANGVIHRDVKPSNIMLVTEGGRQVVKLLDFGIAKVFDGQNDKQLTRTGETFGSPLYMSPEQCLAQKLDERSDVYAVGCVIYECLKGKPPLEGETVYDTIYKQINELPPGLNEISQKRIREAVETVVFRAMAKKPADRYATVTELRKDLELIGAQAEQSLRGLLMQRWRLSLLKMSPERRARFLMKLVIAWCFAGMILLAGLGALAWYQWNLAGEAIVGQKVIPLRLLSDTRVSVNDKVSSTDELMENVAGVAVLNRGIQSRQASDPRRFKSLLRLGEVCAAKGNYEEAGKYFEMTRDVIKQNPALANSFRGKVAYGMATVYLADSHYYRGSFNSAEPLYMEGLETANALSTARHTSVVGEVYFKAGDSQLFTGKFREAADNFSEAEICWKKSSLSDDHNKINDRYGLCLLKHGEALRLSGNYSEAIEVLSNARTLWTSLKGGDSAEVAAAIGLSGLVHSDEAAAVSIKSGEEERSKVLVKMALDELSGAEKILEKPSARDDKVLLFFLAKHAQLLQEQGMYLEAYNARLRYSSILSSDTGRKIEK